MDSVAAQASWAALQQHREALRLVDFTQLPTAQRGAPARLWSVAGLGVDLSHQLTTAQTWPLLEQLAQATGVEAALTALFAGEVVNPSEQAPALHWLARAEGAPTAALSAEYRVAQELREAVQALTQRVHSGEWQGYSGEAISDVVQLGIGGSRLGSEVLVQALAPTEPLCRCHFLSSLDDTVWQSLCRELAPARTLFIIVSRSFNAEETLRNTELAREWLCATGCPEPQLSRHFVAITAAPERVAKTYATAVLVMPPDVGGRYSLWSAPSLSLALSAGSKTVSQLLDGARAMDEHVRTTPPAASLPILLGLLDAWYASCWDIAARVIVPYVHALRGLPAHLQQLMLESNGKSVAADGTVLTRSSSPGVWGGLGTESQHSFHQFLHQGTASVTVDLLLVGDSAASAESQCRLWSNALAQLLMLRCGQERTTAEMQLREDGNSAAESARLAPHLVASGARAATPIVLERMDAHCLGALLALYEHRVYAAATAWHINPFDQWGVVQGKRLGNQLQAVLRGDAPLGEKALQALVDYFATLQGGSSGAA